MTRPHSSCSRIPLLQRFTADFSVSKKIGSKILICNARNILGKYVGIENRLNNLTFNISTLIAEIDKRIQITKNSFLTKTHPAVWELNKGTYSQKIGSVIGETVKQNLDSLSFYGKQAYVRAILFRLFVLAITMLPILYFRRQKKKKDFNINNTNYSLLHKYTGTAAASFAMVMAPFIFINAPHVVIEVIFVTLTITTSHIFLKENPSIKKSNYYIVMISFIIMLLLNLLVSVTLFGRIFWSFSILLCIPLYRIFFDIDKTNLRNKILNKIIIFLTILMVIAGWIMSITGHFPYGRILILNGLANFFLAIVLYVAIYAFIDFIKILADIYNSRNTVSQIRVDLIYSKLVNIVTFLAVIFWISSFLKNINVYPFLKNEVSNWFSLSTNIAGHSINISSILTFILILYFAIYISGLLKGLFYDEQRSSETESKTNLGSYAVLLRLFIISCGFILGMIITGIDLSKFNLIIGALGVGIGFGLQSIFNNLISGLILAFERPIYVGDIIEIDGVKGRVTDIGLRATTVDSMEGAEYIIPNGELISKKTKNWTLTSKNFKIDIQIIVGLENKVDHVIETLNMAIQQSTSIQQYPLPKVSLKEIQTRGLEFSVTCWVTDISKAVIARNELLKNIHTVIKRGKYYLRQKPW